MPLMGLTLHSSPKTNGTNMAIFNIGDVKGSCPKPGGQWVLPKLLLWCWPQKLIKAILSTRSALLGGREGGEGAANLNSEDIV